MLAEPTRECARFGKAQELRDLRDGMRAAFQVADGLFAAGQIVGPTVVGWIADGPGGLARGLVYSAGALWLGSALALRQRALPQASA